MQCPELTKKFWNLLTRNVLVRSFDLEHNRSDRNKRDFAHKKAFSASTCHLLTAV